MRFFILVTVILFGVTLFAGNKAIDADFIQELSRYSLNEKETIVQGMLYTRGLDDVALNPDVLLKHNPYFTHEISTGKITNQEYSGRCWLFAALNMLRPHVVSVIHDEEFAFSQNFLFFYDKLEKANTFFEMIIARADLDIRDPKFQFVLALPWDGPIQDGGYWEYAVTLVGKYGAVPYSAMPDSESARKPDEMNTQLTHKLMLAAYAMKRDYETNKSHERMRTMKKEALKDIYKILVLHLGKPPVEFEFIYKNSEKDAVVREKHTPKSFAKKYVTSVMDDFIPFSYYPSRPFKTVFEGENSNYLVEGTAIRFVNEDIVVIKDMVLQSILAGQPVDFSANVDYQIDSTRGIMHHELYRYDRVYGLDMSASNVEKGLMGLIDSNHDMVIMGVDYQNGKIIKWKVENSWGPDYGDNGMFFMYDGWFERFADGFIIHKKFVKPELLKIWEKQKPTVIPEDYPWR